MSERSGSDNRGGHDERQSSSGRQSERGRQQNPAQHRGRGRQSGQREGRDQRGGQQRGGGQRGAQNRQSGQPSQDRRSGRPPQGPPGGQPPQGGGGDSGVNRRHVLYGGAGLAAAVGGWFVFLRDDGPDNSSPKGAVRVYVEAYDNTDEQQYNNIIHPDGQLQELDDGDLDAFEPVDFSINNIEIVEEGDGEATARVDITADGPGGNVTQTTDVILRQTDDGWKVYSDPGTFGG